MSEANSFEVGGVQFQLEPLKLKQQQKGLTIVAHAILPALMATGAEKVDVTEIVRGIERLPELFDIFAAVTKVNWQANDGETRFVPLVAFADNVFSRRADLFVGYVAECLALEYACFLDGSGKSVLTQAEKRFASLLA